MYTQYIYNKALYNKSVYISTHTGSRCTQCIHGLATGLPTASLRNPQKNKWHRLKLL